VTGSAAFYALVGAGLLGMGLHALLRSAYWLPRILAVNIMGSSIFLVLVALAYRQPEPDPVPHAMVITGIVVAVSATALALHLLQRLGEADDDGTDTTPDH